LSTRTFPFHTLAKSSLSIGLNNILAVDYFLAKGYDINALDERGQSVLSCFFSKRYDKRSEKLFKYFVKSGASMRIEINQSGGNPLTIIQYIALYERGDANDILWSKLFIRLGVKPEEFRYTNHPTRSGEFANETFAVRDFYNQIEKARKAIISLISISLFKKSLLFSIIGKDIIQYISKMVYETCEQPIWAVPSP
jgi:hypothetical protein